MNCSEIPYHKQSFFLPQDDTTQNSFPFFSDQGLAKDIIEVTNAEPDIPLETFCSLYQILWPQIKESGDLPFINAWNYFLGSPLIKGILSPPETLVPYKKIMTIKETFRKSKGELEFFRDFDAVIRSIQLLKERTESFQKELFNREKILNQLINVLTFYESYRSKTKQLIERIIGTSINNSISVDEYGEWENFVEPKAIMMGDIFTGHWAYRVPREKAQIIRPKDTNRIQLDSSTILSSESNHYVAAMPKGPAPKVYFKANGHPLIKPEKEYMVYSLYKLLRIPIPQTALLIFSNIFDNSNEFFAVQASEAVLGGSVLDALNDPISFPIQSEGFIQQVIGAILTTPYDGSFKNYKYSPKYQAYIGIDNDMAFKKDIKGASADKLYMNIKTFLYTLPKMTDIEIPNNIKTMFKTLDPDLTLTFWIQNQAKKNQEYKDLFEKLSFQNVRFIFEKMSPQDSTPNVESCIKETVQVDKDLPLEDRFFPQIKLSNKIIQSLDLKLKKLHELFSKNNQVLTPQDLLDHASLTVGKYYQTLRTKFSDPEEALYVLWQKKDGIDYTILSSILNQESIQTEVDLISQANNEQKLLVDLTTSLEFYKTKLSTKAMSPLYSLISRHGERLYQGILDPVDLLKELRFIIQEDLTERCSPHYMINFWYKSKSVFDNDKSLLKQYNDLILSIPDRELRWLFKLEQYFLRPTDKNILPNDPRYSQQIEGAFLKNRVFPLTQEQRDFIFDLQGLLKKNPSLPGRSRVSYFPLNQPQFYMKAFPEFPGYEYASTSFMRLLGITHLPYQDLIMMKNPEPYPILLSEKVPGVTVLQAWNDKDAFSKLDPFHTFLQILSAMLINPEDGKEDNFILSRDQRYLIPIDNDHCFLPGTVQKQGKFWNIITPSTTLQIKTLLFCLDEMQKPIPATVKAHYLNLNIDELMSTWMEKLVDIQQRYETLFNPEMLAKLYEQGTVLRIPFNRSFIENMYWKAHKIQEVFQTGSELTPFDLLRALEPYVAKHYQDSFKKASTLKERFKKATHDLYTKKMQNNDRMSILNTKAMIKIVNVPIEEISYDSIKSKNGPVSAFEYIKELIANRTINKVQKKHDIVEIGHERGHHVWSDLSQQINKVEKLKKFFQQPSEGLILKDGDLLVNKNLQEYLKISEGQTTKIRFLTILGSQFFTQTEINILIKGCPNLEYLDISESKNLEEVIIKKGDWLSLNRLEARKCPKLQKTIVNSPLRVLRVENDSCKLEIYLDQPDPDIVEISLSPKTKIIFDRAEGFSLKKGSTRLDFVQALMNKVSIIEDLCLTNLKLIIANKTFFNFGTEYETSLWYNLSLQPSQFSTLSVLNTYYSQLKLFGKVNLSGFLFSGHNPGLLDQLKMARWKHLQTLNLSGNSLSFHQIKELVTEANWSNLEDLDLSSNLFTRKDIFMLYLHSDLPKLKTLNLSKNPFCNHHDENSEGEDEVLQFTYLFLNKQKVTCLNLDGLSLGELDLSNKTSKLEWINIQTLSLSDNEISTKTLSFFPFQAWPKLQGLSLSENKILDAGLDELCKVTWSNLIHLDLSNTGLTYKAMKKLSAHKWPKLQILDLSFNSLLARDIPEILDPNFPKLKEVILESTHITRKDLIKLFSQIFYPTISVAENLKGSPAGSPTLKALDRTNKLLLLPEFGLEGESQELEDSTQLMTVSLLEKTGVSPKLNHSRSSDIFELSELMFEQDALSQKEQNSLKMLKVAGWFVMKTCQEMNQMKKSTDGMKFRVQKHSAQIMPKFILNRAAISQEKGDNKSLTNIFILGKWKKIEKPLLKYETFVIDQMTYMFCHVDSNGLLTQSTSFSLNLSDGLSSKDGPIKKRIPNDLGYENLPWQIQGFRIENFSMMETKLTSFFSNHNLEDSLEILNLSNNIIGIEGVNILTCKVWSSLKRVYLRNISATADEFKTIVLKSKWPNLRFLDLSNNLILKQEFKTLAFGQWPCVESIITDQFPVPAQQFQEFMKGANWPDLKDFTFNILYLLPVPDEIPIVGTIIKKWPKVQKKNIQVIQQPVENVAFIKFIDNKN